MVGTTNKKSLRIKKIAKGNLTSENKWLEYFKWMAENAVLFQQTFKNIDDVLWKDARADSKLDYIEQTSWILFMRYLDELEKEKADEAELKGKAYEFILDEAYRWPNWAMPKNEAGELDHHAIKTVPKFDKVC